MNKFLLKLFLLTLLFVCSTSFISNPKTSLITEGDAYSKLQMSRLDGKKENLCDYREKVVLLHFWASYCSPCIEEFKTLHTLYNQFDRKDLEILAISVDADKREIYAFKAKHKIEFPIFHDPRIQLYTYAAGERVSVPYTLILDKNGKTIDRVETAIDWSSQKMTQKIRTLVMLKK